MSEEDRKRERMFARERKNALETSKDRVAYVTEFAHKAIAKYTASGQISEANIRWAQATRMEWMSGEKTLL